MQKQIEEMAKIMANGRFCEPQENQIRLFIGEAETLYNAGYHKQEWISVEERLPTESGKYIVCRADGNVFQAKFYAHPDGKGGQWGTKSKGRTITRWTHMPEPPKGE